MADWKKICCAVDFSDASRCALEEAADLARRFEAELTIVHVYEDLPPTGVDLLPPPVDVSQQTTGEMSRMIEGWARDAERIAGRPVRWSVLTGSAAPVIARFARESGSDLVVVATHGRTGIKRLVLGSVAERVVREAGCPVLVVR